MKLKVIASSSGGNCYVLQPNQGKSLVLEAGEKISELGKAVTYGWSKIAGVLVTHEHQDHASHVAEFQSRGLKVYATEATAAAIDNKNIITLESVSNRNRTFTVGDFKIRWFDTQHDAAHPVGYFIKHHEMGNLLFITDTAVIYSKFKGVNHLMIETNYDPDHPRFNTLSESYINRVRLAHLSIAQANEFIRNNIDDVKSLATVTLLHLSSRHADRQDFKKLTTKTLRELGSNAKVEVATPWLVRDLPNFNKPNF